MSPARLRALSRKGHVGTRLRSRLEWASDGAAGSPSGSSRKFGETNFGHDGMYCDRTICRMYRAWTGCCPLCEQKPTSLSRARMTAPAVLRVIENPANACCSRTCTVVDSSPPSSPSSRPISSCPRRIPRLSNAGNCRAGSVAARCGCALARIPALAV